MSVNHFTMSDVLAYIASHADDDDIRRIYDAARNRQRVLRDVRAGDVKAGVTVRLDGLSPKALNGLTGTVESITGKAAAVRLDVDSTRVLAYGRTKFATSASLALAASGSSGTGEGTYLLNGVPLGCCLTD